MESGASAHGEASREHLFEAMATAKLRLFWSREELASHRTRRLRETLAHAKASSPFYAERLKKLDVERFTESDLIHVPPTTKQDLIANFDRIFVGAGVDLARCEAFLAALDAPVPFGALRVFASSGSSGRRALSVCSERECVLNHGMALALLAGQQRAQRAESTGLSVAIGGASPAHLSATTSAIMQKLDPQRRVTSIPASTPFELLSQRVMELRPSALNGFASILTRLARAQLSGHIQISPEVVVSAGEPLTPEDVATITRAFQCPVHDAYGASELGWMAQTTAAGGPMIHFDDQFVMEPVDAQGQRVGHGVESSAVLFTTLERSMAPLVRYQLNDRIRTAASPDGHPICFTRIESVLGRNDDWFRYGDVEIHPTTFRSVLIAHGQIDEYQVRQTPRGAHVLAVVTDPRTDLAQVARALEAALAGHGLKEPEVSIELKPRFERVAQGSKFRPFLSLENQRA